MKEGFKTWIKKHYKSLLVMATYLIFIVAIMILLYIDEEKQSQVCVCVNSPDPKHVILIPSIYVKMNKENHNTEPYKANIKMALDYLNIAFTIESVVAGDLIWTSSQCFSFANGKTRCPLPSDNRKGFRVVVC